MNNTGGSFEVTGKVVDIFSRIVFPGRITVAEGKIIKVERDDHAGEAYIMPGLTDAHIHIESSMVTPGAFAAEAVRHGTVSVVSDPHEIANVLGIAGVLFMIQDSEKVPLRFFFGAPSCVPATSFESAGARLGYEETRKLLSYPEVHYLSEMMNFPGVIYGDEEVLRKINAAKSAGKPIDGHAPGLRGESLRKYAEAGISTDHECSTMEEALEKIKLGMKILIREGSAARNLDSLKELFRMRPGRIMLCSDDLHPDMLREGHINRLVARLTSEGFDLFDVVRSVSLNPSEHYKLESGLLRKGDRADFILVDAPDRMNVLETWIAGKKVYDNGKISFDYVPGEAVNNFNCTPVSSSDIVVERKEGELRVIRAIDGELLTGEMPWNPGIGEEVKADPGNDILKIVVKDRYHDNQPVSGFITGFGLKEGAFASSVAHDSHNIIAVGANDEDIVSAINAVVSMKGGLAVACGQDINTLQLDIAGIMSASSCSEIAQKYQLLNEHVIKLGSGMRAPFMTLSFMALLVIPDLKIGDRGLFDVKQFRPVSLYI